MKKPSNLRRALFLKGDFQVKVSSSKCISVSVKISSLLARIIDQVKRRVRAFRGVTNNTSNLRPSEIFSLEKRENANLNFEVILSYFNPLFFR